VTSPGWERLLELMMPGWPVRGVELDEDVELERDRWPTQGRQSNKLLNEFVLL
jgi:hypothetical protein